MYGAVRGAGAGQIGSIAIGYLSTILLTAIFHNRYVRTQREFLATPFPWLEFALTAFAEMIACVLSAVWLGPRLANPQSIDLLHPQLPSRRHLCATFFARNSCQDIRGSCAAICDSSI